MTVYSETIYPAATDAAHILRKQVHVAIMIAANDVLNESTATEQHSQRVDWARKALADPADMAERMMVQVLQNGTIQAAPLTSTDNDVQFVINGLVNSFLDA